jgi:oxaloacetate decarboxylase gamma subunit
MDNTTLLSEGLNLMIFGVGFVFVFLTLLVFATSAMSWFIIKLEKKVGVLPEEGIPSPTAVINNDKSSTTSQSTSTVTNENSHLIFILSAAIYKFRLKK